MIESYYLITGMGRSGTKWVQMYLSNFVNFQHMVVHQFNDTFDVENGWNKIFSKSYKGKEFWTKRYKLLTTFTGCRKLIEVNSFPRQTVHGMQEVKPKHMKHAKLAILVRDPRKVVKSFSSWGHFNDPKISSQPNPGNFNLRVLGADVDMRKASRVEKLCWLWRVCYDYLLTQTDIVFTIEGLTSNVEEIKKLHKFVGIKFDKSWWERMRKVIVNEKLNVKESYYKKGIVPFEDYSKWSSEDKATLIRVCGDLMTRFGYKEE